MKTQWTRARFSRMIRCRPCSTSKCLQLITRYISDRAGLLVHEMHSVVFDDLSLWAGRQNRTAAPGWPWCRRGRCCANPAKIVEDRVRACPLPTRFGPMIVISAWGGYRDPWDCRPSIGLCADCRPAMQFGPTALHPKRLQRKGFHLHAGRLSTPYRLFHRSLSGAELIA